MGSAKGGERGTEPWDTVVHERRGLKGSRDFGRVRESSGKEDKKQDEKRGEKSET